MRIYDQIVVCNQKSNSLKGPGGDKHQHQDDTDLEDVHLCTLQLV